MLRTLIMAVLLGLAALLAGCSGGSANLNSPILGPDPNTDCGKKPTLCTTMVFYDDPVENLRYECGVNKGLTDAEGRFTCPMGLDALFYLGEKKEVKLGSIRVPTSDVISYAKDKYVFKDWILPTDLSRAETSTGVSTCGSDAKWKENVLRLIRSLDHDGIAFDAQEANNRIQLPGFEPDPKTSANVLDAELAEAFHGGAAPTTPTDFMPCDFANDTLFESKFGGSEGVLQKVHDALVAASLKGLTQDAEEGGSLLLSKGFATARFEEARRQLIGGTYSILGPFDLTGVGVALPTMSSHQFLADRNGVPFGFGLLRRVTGTGSNVSLEYDPFYFRQLNVAKPAAEQVLSQFAEDGTLMTGSAVGFTFATRPKVNNVQVNGTLTLSGRMISNQIWPFASNYNSAGITAKDADLGKWSEKDVNGDSVSNSQGGMGMFMSAALPTTLSTDHWNNVVASGATSVKHYNLRLDYTDASNTRQVLANLPVTLLRNGTVITDLDSDCSAVNTSTLQDAGTQQEYRVGVIGSIRTLGSTKFASLYLAFGVEDLRGTSWEAFNGLQLDRSKGDVGIIIDFTTAAGPKHLTLRELDSAGVDTEASWVNAIRAQVSALTDPNKKPSADSQGKVIGSVRAAGAGCP